MDKANYLLEKLRSMYPWLRENEKEMPAPDGQERAEDGLATVREETAHAAHETLEIDRPPQAAGRRAGGDVASD